MSRYQEVRFDPTPVPCYPTANPEPKCWTCGRFRPGLEPGGKTVVIDGTAIPQKTSCAMFVARPQ